MRSAGNAPKGATAVEVTEGGSDVRLNFVNVDLQEFARAVFDEVLHETVIVDPGVTGRITVRTSSPVSRKAAVGLVREALLSGGATLSKPAGVWRIGPAPRNTSAREMVRVIPLRFISIADAKQAIQPFASGTGAEVAASGAGRFLILAGRAAEIDSLEQVITTFDVDELRGRAFALIPLRQANASAVAQDLMRMVGVEGLAQGLKIFPVERMNAVMVASSDPDLIDRARKWVGGLDQSGQDRRRVYVYPVRNRRAAELAKVLDGMLQGRGRVDAGAEAAAVAPGLTPQQGSLFGTGPGGRTSLGTSLQLTAMPAPEQPREDMGGSATSRGAGARESAAGIEVRADTATNTLVVVSRPEDYAIVASAIRSLDVLPPQVLIEATIAEVRLTNELRHGVRWFFQSGHHGIGLGAGAPVTGLEGASGATGLTYSFGVPSAKVAISALESVTDVEIVSSPALTVLDNQTATLKVGQQVPIATRSSRSVISPDAPLVNDIEMKDTGVILQVTPRVNAGGLIMLDVKQEASDVVPTNTSRLDSPTIRLRQITSTIAVKSGAEIVLGGIIQRSQQRENDGIPVLKDIPVLGNAFTSLNGHERERTELVIIIRPTIMANPREVQAVTSEIKQRMRKTARPVVRARY
ncbi:type II secretion system secretin GspD [Methylobacterium currus]|uniref:type II secretion system secretin GspD n=1 Tax=Methylobacterium currus TaxID=2051553 RepID=UPI001E517E21|nr:type II secretion system secretin GspD [Methylobacterium currus]UHC17853.1 type II secretion system secretin GspD [Methylobacterium currus]